MSRDFFISLRTTAVLWVLTVVLYPLLIWGVGQVLFPTQANGSVITNAQGEVIGSTLIGQGFSSDIYFLSRPSAIDYSQGEKAAPTGLSGASNLAPSNPDLIEGLQQNAAALQQEGMQPTADLIYSSGSGLDPHISPEAAQAQIARVAAARGVDAATLQGLIENHTEGRFLGIFGEPGVNVLALNIALDEL
ncbi:MAG TPA: K(+)-transporting ATPase subunit C [Leptolyngbyaceae cyanobacterium]